MEVMTVYGDNSEENIYFPKPVRKFPKRKSHKSKNYIKFSNNGYIVIDNYSKCNKNSKFNLENITIEEINNDFLKLFSKGEEEQCFDEIYTILTYGFDKDSYHTNNKKQNKNRKTNTKYNINNFKTKNIFQIL